MTTAMHETPSSGTQCTPDAIEATSTCFDDALHFFSDVLNIERTREHSHFFRVVHGVCLAGDADYAYAHGWVEQRECRSWYTRTTLDEPDVPDEMVWQAGKLGGRRIYFSLARDEFYRRYRVQSFTAYTVALAAELNKVTGHLGPWRRDYLALAGRPDDVAGTHIGRVDGVQPLVVVEPQADGVVWHGVAS